MTPKHKHPTPRTPTSKLLDLAHSFTAETDEERDAFWDAYWKAMKNRIPFSVTEEELKLYEDQIEVLKKEVDTLKYELRKHRHLKPGDPPVVVRGVSRGSL